MRGLGRLDRFNRLSEEEATGELLAVCHARRWAQRVAAGRPYPDVAALQGTADEVWTSLGPDDWLEALEGHPRIGEGGGRSPNGPGRSRPASAAVARTSRSGSPAATPPTRPASATCS